MENRLTEKQAEFVKTELGLTEDEFYAKMKTDYNQLIEDCVEIEIEETSKAGDNDLSPRGVMAVEMVDLVHGPYDEEEDDEW